ncbi:MAG: NUDIX domain-containing protein [Mariprofundaceae bacterium]|nr:NUDIX domain-containing protein [Mariprofundaceae bacterium]
MNYRFLSQQSCYQGFFSLDRHTVEHDCFNGPPLRVERENMERGDAVAVLLYDEASDAVLLLEQFRIGPAVRQDNPWLIEIVAGMVEIGEGVEATARRECVEEAGYAADHLEPLGQYYVSPGGTSERITLYLARVNRHQPVGDGGGVADEQEDIRRFWCPRSKAMEWVIEGKINSGAPMLALLLAFGAGVAS